MPFSFLNAAFLVGAVAAVVPILIHLFSRRKVARIPFSSIRFLEEIARRRVRRMRLTQWIILALRVLALALLALGKRGEPPTLLVRVGLEPSEFESGRDFLVRTITPGDPLSLIEAPGLRSCGAAPSDSREAYRKQGVGQPHLR